LILCHLHLSVFFWPMLWVWSSICVFIFFSFMLFFPCPV
jgi:hypothetical protein